MFKIVRIRGADREVVANINKLLPQLSSKNEEIKTTDGRLKEVLSNEDFYLLAALDNQKIVGVGSIFFQKTLTKMMAEIHDIVVDQNYRGKGLGEKLTKELLKITKQIAKKSKKKIYVYLTSRPSRIPANNMYLKLRFKLLSKAHGENGTNFFELTIS